MGPRLKDVEDELAGNVLLSRRLASMGPRLKDVEDDHLEHRTADPADASMGPRLKDVEDRAVAVVLAPRGERFNGATSQGRGRRYHIEMGFVGV